MMWNGGKGNEWCMIPWRNLELTLSATNVTEQMVSYMTSTNTGAGVCNFCLPPYTGKGSASSWAILKCTGLL